MKSNITSSLVLGFCLAVACFTGVPVRADDHVPEVRFVPIVVSSPSRAIVQDPSEALLAQSDVLLAAIREVETGNNPAKRGSRGERGAYQFRRATWRQHTRQPFSLAADVDVSARIARSHLAWLVNALMAAGIEPRPYSIALAWNAGVHAVCRNRAPANSHYYATRVVNVFNEALPRESRL